MRSNHRVICFVAAASLAGCAENLASHASPETPTTGADRATVTGRVVDTSGIPVPGATVALRSFGEHATADAMGLFTLDVPANTTLTIAATAPNMAPTLLQQLMVSPAAKADVEIPMITTDRFKSLVTMGANPAGGVLAVALKSMSGSSSVAAVTYTHLRAHETPEHLVCRHLLEKKNELARGAHASVTVRAHEVAGLAAL